MILKMQLDFDAMDQYMATPTNPDLNFVINLVTECENCEYEAGTEFNKIEINLKPSTNYMDFTIYADNDTVDYVYGTPSNFMNDLGRIVSDTSQMFVVKGNVTTTNSLLSMVYYGMVIINFDGLTAMYLYKQNSANNVLNKSLTLITIIQGSFNTIIPLKNVTIDLKGLLTEFSAFNYVWIPSFERYYYVDRVDLISADYVRFYLREDVLMSWQDLIRSQNAFITRQENNHNADVLIDERLPLTDDVVYDYFSSSINHLSYKNVTFDTDLFDTTTGFDITKNTYNILISTYTDIAYTSRMYRNQIESPYNSGLPNISAKHGLQREYFLAITQLGTLNAIRGACEKNDTIASYFISALWLPFDPTNIFPNKQLSSHVYCGDKELECSQGGSWVNHGATLVAPPSSYWIFDAGVPYLVLADFNFNNAGGITGIKGSILERQSKWEIYVPFVSWVEVNFDKIYNKRIQVIYTLDSVTGIGTAMIYNYTDKYIIWSSTCQIGVKLDIVTTNELENTKQKQANDLNMILGAMSSVLSIGVGVATSNPVASVGGVLSLSKSIASNVNAKSMMFDRANISFGTSNTAMYSPLEVNVRRSYHNEIPLDSDVYARMQGYPYNTYGTLTGLTGYTEIGEIQFNPSNHAISQDEITEIVSLLKDGVVL